MKKSTTILTMLILTVLLSGWTRVWHFVVNNLSDPTHPGFCISIWNNCKGEGVDFSSLFIAEVDERGHYVYNRKMIKPMWIIHPVTAQTLKEVTYGRVPEGWEAEGPAKPLERGKFYTVNGEFYFRIIENGEQMKADVFDHSSFMKKFYQ